MQILDLIKIYIFHLKHFSYDVYLTKYNKYFIALCAMSL
jgi:hypothetical protein